MLLLRTFEETKSVEHFEPARVSILKKVTPYAEAGKFQERFFLLATNQEHLYWYLVPRGLEKEQQKQAAAAKVLGGFNVNL